MARIVNKYIIPDGELTTTRQGALKRIQAVFSANREAIEASIREYAASTQGEIRGSIYDVFETNVLENLSEKYGGRDKRKKVKDKQGYWHENDINIEEALNKSLNSMSLTPPAERGKRNFLVAIKHQNARMYDYIKRRMGALTREHGFFDGIPLGDVWYDDSAEHTTYMIRTADGKLLKAIFEATDDGSPEWHLYDENGKELIF